MCTAVTFDSKDFYFGRTLDVDFDVTPAVTITPRNYPFKTLNISNHYAIIGMALVVDYPLYFDATNEYGLSMAGLNFPQNAMYFDKKEDKFNIRPCDLIPYILGTCKTSIEAKNKLENINITNEDFSKNIPNNPLHWIVADKNYCFTVEQTINGLKIFDNPVGVLTNNPTFDWHITNLNNYINLTSLEATNRFSNKVDLAPFCKGMGGLGLPGDLSSQSRFVRTVFTKLNAIKYDSEEQNVSQFFHILGSVFQTNGLAQAGQRYEQTLYISCCNTSKGIYYYTTYFNTGINAVNIHNVDLDTCNLFSYKLQTTPTINKQN